MTTGSSPRKGHKMENNNGQTDLFSQPTEKKEDTMNKEESKIDKVRRMSAKLKFLPGGSFHPARLKEDEITNPKS